jgi:hypothetical protein
VIDERLERVRDLAGVAKVVVEDQRYQRHRRRAVPAEDTLTFVGEDVKTTGVTDQPVTNDPQVRKLLRTGPGFAQEVSRLAMSPFCTTTRCCTTACRGPTPTSAPASAR